MSTKKDWKKHFHRMKQIAEQNLGRAERSEVLNEDLVQLEKRVNKIKAICQSTIKKLSACLPLSGSANPDKTFRKLPESMLAVAMLDSAGLLGNDDTLGVMYSYCGRLQSILAREVHQYSGNVENQVLNPIQAVLETEIPAITKLRKQLTKLTLDMDSAKGRFQSMLKQSSGNSSSSLSSKVETLKNEMEHAENCVQQCRDQLIIEMYSFLAREGQLSDVLLALINLQIEFHRHMLESLENSLPQMKQHAEAAISRPVFGCSLVTHLQHTKRDIAVVIEKCVRSLILNGINEEGLFRVPSSSTKVKKLKAGFDANIVNMDDYHDDSHCVAAVLKSYLRELPEPLMTFELYSDWMHIMELAVELRQNALWVLVDKLPKPNYNNLRYIIKFLAKLAANSDCNKMSSSNIAIVIGPNLLWPPGDNGPSVLSATSHSAIIEILINKSEWFFPGDLDFGVSESDLMISAKNRLNDGSVKERNLSTSSSTSSKMPPSYISKYRFFNSIFDDSNRGSLKMSPSNTRLSLNSLSSLNDNESGFERKYSFSSLLEERTSNWDSENDSFKWRKLSRVESGMLSLNTSFSYANRSPIPSSSTSPAISMANLALDAPCTLTSVTKSPSLSVTTTSARRSPLNLTTTTNAHTVRPHSAVVSETVRTRESLAPTSSSSVASRTLGSTCQNVGMQTSGVADVPSSGRASSQPDDPSLDRHLPLSRQIDKVAGDNFASIQSEVESPTAADDSKIIADLFSPVFSSSDLSTAASFGDFDDLRYISAETNLAVSTETSITSSSDKAVLQESNTENEVLSGANSLVSFSLSFADSPALTIETFTDQTTESVAVSNDGNPNEISRTTALSSTKSNEKSVSVGGGDESTATKELSVTNTAEKSPWINRIGAKLGFASSAAPGKERVKLGKNPQRVESASHKEKRNERRSSEPPSDVEPAKTKSVKKSRSLSTTSPYDISRSGSKGASRKAKAVKSAEIRVAAANVGEVGSGISVPTVGTAENGNGAEHSAGSTMFSTADDAPQHSGKNSLVHKEDFIVTSSALNPLPNECKIVNGKNEFGAEKSNVSKNLAVVPNCCNVSGRFNETHDRMGCIGDVDTIAARTRELALQTSEKTDLAPSDASSCGTNFSNRC